MWPLPTWLIPLAVLLTLVCADRPCAGCGRWFGHRLICPRRPL